jgi:bacterioferritin (cytochrome b1)
MNSVRPSHIHTALRRIASRIEKGTNPSLSGVLEDLGRVVLAIEGDVPVLVESDPEGNLACPRAEMISHLNNWLTAKYAIDIAYRNFGARIRGPWRDSLVDHWTEHAGDEREHAYDIAMKIVGLGGDPLQTAVQLPPVPANLEAFFRTLMRLEQDAIVAGRKTITMAGENTGLKVLAENIVLKDNHHLDDLRRMSMRFELPV